MAKKDILLEFSRYLVSAPVSQETARDAVIHAAPEFHLQRLTLDVSGAESYLPQSEIRFFTIFENPEVEDYGPSLDFVFQIKEGEEIIFSFYPGELLWDEEEKKSIELLSEIMFFYFSRIRMLEMLEKSSHTQYLTGLPNAGGYLAAAAKVFREGRIHKFNATYFNIKGFGMVSRRYGTEEGDDIMRRYAAKVKAMLWEDELLGHLGGDNYVALIRKEHCTEFLKDISDVTVSAYRTGVETGIHLSCHIGAMDIPDDFTVIGEIIGLPAVALSVARNVTRENVAWVTDSMLRHVSWQKQIEQMFPSALRNEEFVVYYQPKVDSRTSELAGAEGLVRWFHDGRLIPPGDFITPLEREGVVAALDLYVLRHVCADIRHWMEEGVPTVPISVNFSRRDLEDPGLALQIDEIIRTFGIDRNLIQIEVTETVDEKEHGMLTEFLNDLWNMKISTAIDDFGSGYSSLSTLRSFRVSVLKIDRSFISNDILSEKDEIILKDIIHMADNLGIEVVTEGVEREEQLEFVNKVGCFIIQGFYYDRPLPKSKFRERMIQKKY